MKFLFVHAWQGFSLAEWYLREALANRCTAAVSVHALDLPPAGIPANDLLPRVIASWKPDVVGFSCHYWSIDSFLEASAVVKHLHPAARVVLGGPQVRSDRASNDALARAESVDYVIRGEGEIPLCRLMESCARGATPADIPSVSYRAGGQIVHNPVSRDPGWKRTEIFSRANADLMDRLPLLREVSYETVTGCRSKCAYCYYPTSPYRVVDMDLVRSELTFICSSEIPILRICDPHFGGSRKRALDILCHLRAVSHATNVKIYPDLLHVDGEYLNLMHEANAEPISVGVETTNPRSLAMIRRGSVRAHERAVQLLLEAFPSVPADVIVGLPGDDVAGLRQTFQDVLDMGFSAVNVLRLSLFPGTVLAENEPAYFGAPGVLRTSRGQVLSSAAFPLEVQQEASCLAYAAEIACRLVHTREHLQGQGTHSRMLDLLCTLDPATLIQIHAWVTSKDPETISRHSDAIIDALSAMSGNAVGLRSWLRLDLSTLRRHISG